MIRIAGVLVAVLLAFPALAPPGATPGFPPGPAASAVAGLAAQGVVSGGAGRAASSVELRLPGGRQGTLPLFRHRGYLAVPASELGALGWEARSEGGRVLVRHRTGIELTFHEGSPWLQWDDELLQLADEVYAFGSDTFLPVQVIVDILPGMLPGAYRYDAAGRTLFVEGAISQAPGGAAGAAASSFPASSGASAAPAAGAAASTPLPRGGTGPSAPADRAPRSRVVVIDPGHGGNEPGAVGPGGTMEKTVALAVGLALARELEKDPWIEVHLTRDRDVAVPLWGRGEQATVWKGERPGVFVSIHANAVPDRPGVRGFETYFLSEARTEHERRVAAAENAPLRRDMPDAPGGRAEDPLLAGILRDLITFDHQHWSSLLAEMVQRELATFHPGPDRGVKQGPFAVITNAMMPSVLVELGFITNRDEERLMATPEFHRQSAVALADAIRGFFDRYPPGGTDG
ncbi:MAG: N-acetylmuramoyl-L-alanine amidase [Gemmatimonadales bacterium]|nr:MAG: N-acetylmuramoyl-L-alanine amidase [Gemmatimonadales bacterium]